MEYETKNEKETRALAEKFAARILARKQGKGANVLALTGELGAGKTTFIKSFIRALGVRRRVTSPTFIIMRRFRAPSGGAVKNIFHIDAYRIEESGDMLGLDFDKAIQDSQNVVIVEWAEKIKDILPKDAHWIEFKYGKGKNERRIAFN